MPKTESDYPFYVIDSFDETKVISCASEECALIESHTSGIPFLDGSDENQKSIIMWNDSNNKWKSADSGVVAASNGVVAVNKFYIDAGSKIGSTNSYRNLIKCVEGSCSLKLNGDANTISLYYIDGGTDGNIITCSNAGCTTDPNGALSGSSPEKTYYIDGMDSGNIITCSNSSCTSGKGNSTVDGVGYIDGAKNNNKYSNVITCSSSSSGNPPTDVTACVSNPGSQLDGYVYIDGGTINGSIYPNIITCKEGNCISEVGIVVDSSKGVGYINGRGVKENNNSIKYTKIITCSTSGGCVSGDSSIESGHVYINGKDYTIPENTTDKIFLKIIKCSSTGCSSFSVTNYGRAFIDGNTISTVNENSLYNNIIICTESDGCLSYEVTFTKVDGLGYIDGRGDDSNNNNIKYTKIITCNTENDGCKSEEGSQIQGHVYIDALQKSTNKYTNIIYCTSSVCTSRPITETPGYGFIDGKYKEETTITDTKKRSTINTYPNIIKCTTDNGCQSTTIQNIVEGVGYIDGLTTSNIIICTQITNDNVNCESKASVTSNDTVSKRYYIDSDDNGNIITCSRSSCSSDVNGATSVTGGVPQNTYYIDGTNSGNIITCSSSSCTSDEGNSTVDGVGYIDGAKNNNKYSNVITCSSSSSGNPPTDVTACVSNPGSQLDGYVYIDGGTINGSIYPNIITCKEGNCISEVGIVVDSSKGVGYINGRGVKENNNSIKYTKIITCSTSGGCVSGDSSIESGHVYINGKDYTIPENTTDKIFLKIIKCSSTGCSSFSVTNYGRAFIDGNTISTVNENSLYNNIIICTESDGCLSYEVTFTKVDGLGYIDGRGDDSNNNNIKYTKIITCNTENDGCKSEEGSQIQGHVYIDALQKSTNKYTNIIYCTSSVCTSRPITETPGYGFIDGKYKEETTITDTKKRSTINTYPNIIKCTTDNGCQSTTIQNIVEGVGYIDGLTTSNIIICTQITNDNVNCESKASVTSNDTLSKRYYIDSDDNGNIITCSRSSCSSGVNGAVAASGSVNGPIKTYFIDGTDETTMSIITCSNNSCQSNMAITDTGHVYIDGGKDNQNKYTKLIDCTNPTKGCVSINRINRQGYGYIDSDNNKNVILCTSDACESTEIDTSKSNAYFINGLTNTDVITCTSASCSSNVGSKLQGHAYIDYTSSAMNVIICSNNQCESIKANIKDGFAYIDGDSSSTETGNNRRRHIRSEVIQNTTSSTPIHPNIIKCYSDGCSSSEGSTDIGVGYIDGITSNNIILCTNDNGCISSQGYKGKQDFTYSYIDGKTQKILSENGKRADISDLYINIIQCNNTGCKTLEGSTVDGEAYISGSDDAFNKILLCDTSHGCVAIDGKSTTVDTYVNAIKPSQIINCQTQCVLLDSTPRENRSEYYPISINGSNSIINCVYSKNTKCSKIETASSTSITTKRSEENESASFASNVFINSLYNKNNGDDKGQLIRCNASSLCKSEEITIADYPIIFYPNSDHNNTEKYMNSIIRCEASGSSDVNVRCSIMSGSNGKIYLNSNYDVNNKQLIICNENGCLETKTNSNEEDTSPEYYVNAGASNRTNKLMDTLIKCSSSTTPCEISTAENEDVHINHANMAQIIQCFSDKGCIAINSRAGETKNEIYVNSGDLSNGLIICKYNEKRVECHSSNGVENQIYLNSANANGIIQCGKNGCVKKESQATEKEPEYFINADTTNTTPLAGDLIKCRKFGVKIICDVTDGVDGDVYINGNANNDSEGKQLIICTSTKGCYTSSSKVTSETNPEYYINSGFIQITDRLTNALIQCSGSSSQDVICKSYNATINSVYYNANEEQRLESQLIKCSKVGCKSVTSKVKENTTEIYINGSNNEDSNNNIIACSFINEKIQCEVNSSPKNGIYLNGNYEEVGDNHQLIKCSTGEGCVSFRSQSSSTRNIVEYYVNAEVNNGIENALLFCSNKICSRQTPSSIPSYYIGIQDEINGLIECTSSSCTLKSAFTSQGYFLNSCYNKAVNQTIVCDSTEGCQTQKVDLGYYLNAGDSNNPVIKCEKEGAECEAINSACSSDSSSIIAGGTCYQGGKLLFYPSSNSTAITASGSEDYYTFAVVSSGDFPGIQRSTGALFKVSRYFVNRFYKSGVVMIDNSGKLVNAASIVGLTETTLYDCDNSSKNCVQRPGCTPNTYMFDSENKKAIFCNNGNLEYAEFTGYVIDGSGNSQSNLIHCQNKGNECSILKTKKSSYYVNSGYDSNTKSLISCNRNKCTTEEAEIGFYLGHEDSGIIQCSSPSSCNFSQVKNNIKYPNSGLSKKSNPIINCTSKGCSVTKGRNGYFLTYVPSLLIHCYSASNCELMEPAVSYYDNAEASDTNNSIINCEEIGSSINCSEEVTNNGFYISSTPNVIIRCRDKDSCKKVHVNNGIFHGALKGLNSYYKRSYDDSDHNINNGNDANSSNTDDELENETDINRNHVSRDSEEVYGIIRCYSGKCSVLSNEEVAAIPICEFNKNRCYITLNYSMMKSATTSIKAGEICTNEDRSIFYFATDTVVVKPNVISGETSTYFYTTTDSNCLEVNDSYDDMYFAVDSNIYLLDQGSVMQFSRVGYYFINTSKNVMVTENDINKYNEESVKFYQCDGNSCKIVEKPNIPTYYVSSNKRIIKYNPDNDNYSFAYEKDIICIYKNNKCTPNADLKSHEFCITYKGELALAQTDIKNRESGDCYVSSSINSSIYGYRQSQKQLYHMNMDMAQRVEETGYFIVNLSTNNTITNNNNTNNAKIKRNKFIIYGCKKASCEIYEPDESTFYYDDHAKILLKYDNEQWVTPETSGYAYISIDPTTTSIYQFTKSSNLITITSKASNGYYYTIDQEMYYCDDKTNVGCSKITESGYYFTNTGEVFYCLYDSEELEATECTKQLCMTGQYYYINDSYYRCESKSKLQPVLSKYCNNDENLVINFPISLTKEYPDYIKQSMEKIIKNNNSTAIVPSSKNVLTSVSGIFTNCTYNSEERKSTFDFVCLNNYVIIDETTDDVKICSIEHLGYVECNEDNENPEKCSISGAQRLVINSLIYLIIFFISTIFLIYYY
ncbi:MAG: hypothetical protein E7Z84_05745 [Methanosphaera stadtmanae]|nr:hypothetical protein [Methanosphaera stadtmanae]